MFRSTSAADQCQRVDPEEEVSWHADGAWQVQHGHWQVRFAEIWAGAGTATAAAARVDSKALVRRTVAAEKLSSAKPGTPPTIPVAASTGPSRSGDRIEGEFRVAVGLLSRHDRERPDIFWHHNPGPSILQYIVYIDNTLF